AAGNRRAAGFPRRQPRLSGGVGRRHPAARRGAGGGEHTPGRLGMAPSAAPALPRLERMSKDHEEMRMTQFFSRRDVLRASTAIAASGAFASVTSAAPPASAVTPELIAAAKKEGKVVYYTSIDLPVAERIAKAFEATYPGIAVRV